jgi:hypothetical protein
MADEPDRELEGSNLAATLATTRARTRPSSLRPIVSMTARAATMRLMRRRCGRSYPMRTVLTMNPSPSMRVAGSNSGCFK